MGLTKIGVLDMSSKGQKPGWENRGSVEWGMIDDVLVRLYNQKMCRATFGGTGAGVAAFQCGTIEPRRAYTPLWV